MEMPSKLCKWHLIWIQPRRRCCVSTTSSQECLIITLRMSSLSRRRLRWKVCESGNEKCLPLIRQARKKLTSKIFFATSLHRRRWPGVDVIFFHRLHFIFNLYKKKKKVKFQQLFIILKGFTGLLLDSHEHILFFFFCLSNLANNTFCWDHCN